MLVCKYLDSSTAITEEISLRYFRYTITSLEIEGRKEIRVIKILKRSKGIIGIKRIKVNMVGRTRMINDKITSK